MARIFPAAGLSSQAVIRSRLDSRALDNHPIPMGVLTTADRKSMPQSDYALPGKHYPLYEKGRPSPSHGRDALSRISANGTPAQKSAVRRKVRRLFPGMKVSGT
jgi:hypothetical protein